MTDTNIAEDINAKDGGDIELMDIGREVKEGQGADWDSMADWRADIEMGLE